MESNQVVATTTNNTNLLAIGGISALVGFGLTYLLQKQNEKEESQPGSPSKRGNGLTGADSPRRRPTKKQKSEPSFFETMSYRLNLGPKVSNQNELIEELRFLDEPTCEIQNIPHLASILGMTDLENIVSPLLECDNKKPENQGYLPEMSFISQNSYVLSKAHFGPKNSVTDAKKYLRAGPRKHVFFNSEEVRACIVTCGGLCPGLNVVIREIVNCLYYNYRVKSVYGIRYGHKGFYTYEWEELTPEKVLNIHHLGGSILGSSRGGFDVDKILDAVQKNGINQIYCIGGDGTHRSIYELYKEISKRKLRITIAGVPKTIDNDIPIIDKSFGFESAVEEATRAIRSADVEANAAEYGVGLVKLMGRHAGFIAMYASLANRDVNICLVPEFAFELGGPRGLLEFVARRLKFKRKCVIVVAEGVPSAILDARLDDVGQNASGQVMFAVKYSFFDLVFEINRTLVSF